MSTRVPNNSILTRSTMSQNPRPGLPLGWGMRRSTRTRNFSPDVQVKAIYTAPLITTRTSQSAHFPPNSRFSEVRWQMQCSKNLKPRAPKNGHRKGSSNWSRCECGLQTPRQSGKRGEVPSMLMARSRRHIQAKWTMSWNTCQNVLPSSALSKKKNKEESSEYDVALN